MACCAVETIGWIFLAGLGAKLAFDFLHFLYTVFLGSLIGLNIDLAKCGPWAVVTGATDGIGKAYANKLASAGLDLVLISRSPEKLETVALELRFENPKLKNVKTIAVDFTDGQSIYDKLKKELSGLEIGILVNNVGMADGKRYDYLSEEVIHNLVNCNIMSMARMCHIVLPQMIKRKKGVIINIGSLSSATPTPFLTLYGATKAFVDKFSQDLAAEVRSLGVTIQTVHPGFVLTKLAKLKRTSLFVPEVNAYVVATLRTLGLESRTAGFWVHKIQLYLSDFITFFVPRRWVENLVMKTLKRTHGGTQKSKPEERGKKAN